MTRISTARNGKAVMATHDSGDARIIEVLRREPLATFTQIATETGLSEKTVAKRYRTLVADRVISIVARVVPTDGRVSWLIRLSADPRHVDQLGAAITEHPRSRWVSASADRQEIVFGLVGATGVPEPLLETITSIDTVSCIRVHQLLSSSFPSSPSSGGHPEHVELDNIDERIAHALSRNGRRANASIATELGISTSNVLRRRGRMEERGIIRYTVDVDPVALGSHQEAMLWISSPAGMLGELTSRLETIPPCIFTAITTGATNLVATLQVSDIRELVTIVDSLPGGLVEIQMLGHTFKRSGDFLMLTQPRR